MVRFAPSSADQPCLAAAVRQRQVFGLLFCVLPRSAAGARADVGKGRGCSGAIAGRLTPPVWPGPSAPANSRQKDAVLVCVVGSVGCPGIQLPLLLIPALPSPGPAFPFPPDRPGHLRLTTARRCFLKLTVTARGFSRLQVSRRCFYRPKVMDDRRNNPGFSLPPSQCRGRWEQSSGKLCHPWELPLPPATLARKRSRSRTIMIKQKAGGETLFSRFAPGAKTKEIIIFVSYKH